MASIVRWDPVRDVISFRDMVDRLVEEGLERAPAPWVQWGAPSMAVDMYETADSVVVKTAIPGVKPEQIQISVSGDTLTIKAEAEEEKEIKRESYLRRERRYGSYCRSVALPGGLQADKADADYTAGILTLTIPKAEEVKPKAIKVTAKS